jgi:hypothetical protein
MVGEGLVQEHEAGDGDHGAADGQAASMALGEAQQHERQTWTDDVHRPAISADVEAEVLSRQKDDPQHDKQATQNGGSATASDWAWLPPWRLVGGLLVARL